MAVSGLYTPSGGFTSEGQQQANFQNLLNSIVSMPMGDQSIQDLQDAYTKAQSLALGAGMGQSDYAQNVQQTLTNQAGIPGLISQYGDLGKIFELYLHDDKLHNQNQGGSMSAYDNPALLASSATTQGQMQGQNQAAQTVAFPSATPPPSTNVPNPYLASSADIVSTAANAPQAPYLTTAENIQPVRAASHFADLLTQLIGGEQNLVDTTTQKYLGAYQDKMGVLNSIAQLLGSAYSQKLAQQQIASTPGGYGNAQNMRDRIVADANRGVTFRDLVSKYRPLGIDPNDILSLYYSVGYYKDKQGNVKPVEEDPSYLEGLGIKVPASTIKAQQTKQQQKEVSDFSSKIADQIYSSWKQMSPVEKVLAYLPGIEKVQFLAPNYANIQSLFYGDLMEGIRKAGIGGRITQFEIKWMHDFLLPGPGDSEQTAINKIRALKQALTKKAENPNYTIGSESSRGYKIIRIK